MDDFVQFVVMVLILAVVAVFTWVRKTIEKMREGGESSPVDVAKGVRDQLRKYMKAAGHLDPMSRRPESGVIVTDDPVESPVRPAAEVVSKPLVPAHEPVPLVVRDKRFTSLRDVKAAATTPDRKRKSVLKRGNVRNAIVLAELLGPPLAERKDFRLF